MRDPEEQDLKRAAVLFKALSHPARLRLACRLSDGEAMTQKALMGELDWPQSTMARHVGELRRSGLVKAERRGVEVELRAVPVVSELMSAVCEWRHPETGDGFTRKYGKPVEATA